MAKLSIQTKLKRLRAEGYSRKQLADAFGVSVSSIGRAERGQTSGATIHAQTDQFYKLGKKAKASVVSGESSLPSAKPKREPKPKPRKEAPAPRVVTPLEKAEGDLAVMDGDSIVIVHITMGSTGKSRTLWARGGVEVSEIRGRLKAACDKQAARQGRGNANSISNDRIDWDDVVDISIEEY